MATSSCGAVINKLLLVWMMPISDTVADTFAMVSTELKELVNFVSEDISKTDTAFHLIIPLDCLEELLNDPVYQFPQVQRIDVYYDDTDNLAQTQRRFNIECEKLHFCSINDLPRCLETIEFDNALASLDPNYQNIKNAIASSIQDRVTAKRSIDLTRRSQVLRKFSSNFLYGFPVKKIDSLFFCSSCKLVFHQLYRLECGHRKCEICLNIQKRCATCSTIVLRDKVWLDQGFRVLMQNLTTSCISCEWSGPFETYEEHLKENHHQLCICSVRNLQDNDDNFHQSSLDGTCIWEIRGMDTLMNNTGTDRGKSIYSSTFYSSPNGYKGCFRIFLNGDAKARGTFISLYFVLMRGNYDKSLQWPFKCKITFTLLNHSSPNDNESYSFWSDTTSSCFQLPRSDMNIPYGISKFFSLGLFKKNQNQYIENDSICIRVEVDFVAERSISPSIAYAGELPNEEEHADRTYDDFQRLLCDSNAS